MNETSDPSVSVGCEKTAQATSARQTIMLDATKRRVPSGARPMPVMGRSIVRVVPTARFAATILHPGGSSTTKFDTGISLSV